MPAASPPRLVVTGFYRYVRNPIYVGFLIILIGQTLLTGSPGMLEYTAIAWCIGAAAVRFYEEPVLACKFGAEYQAYRRAVHAWCPDCTPGRPASRTPPPAGDAERSADTLVPHSSGPASAPASRCGPAALTQRHQAATRSRLTSKSPISRLMA